jgi:hypothetical protein
MIKKTKLNKKAITLRKKGLTYSAILEKIPVAKSTLALWFKEVKLSVPQQQRITKARLEAGLRGGLAKHNQRIKRSREVIQKAEKEVGKISKREMWLIGIILYWGEGSKEKEWKPGSGTQFMNMDGQMIKIFLKWLYYCKVNKNKICFEIHLHENHKHRINEIRKYWSTITKFPTSSFERIYFKKNKINTNRKNIGQNYRGTLKITVRQSSTLLRQITGWIKGISDAII